MDADVVIVGAGFAGIYAAWRLAHDNLRVVVIDASSEIGGNLRGRHWNGYWLDNGTQFLDCRTTVGEIFFLDILGENTLILDNTEWASVTDNTWTYGFEMPDLSTMSTRICRQSLAELRHLRKDGTSWEKRGGGDGLP